MPTPVWITPAGLLGTFTERVSTSTSILASGGDITYKIISGELPNGLTFNTTGTIFGIPFSVNDVLTSKFVVRATNSSGITDRTFTIDIAGPNSPNWLTPEGILSIGPENQKYIINKQLVNFSLEAISDVPGASLKYFIKPGNGNLPKGLSLNSSGLISGIIEDTVKIDYIFTATVSDGIIEQDQEFQIKVENANNLKADTTSETVDTTNYNADSSILICPQWVTESNLGIYRTNNRQVIKLEIYDPYPNVGTVIFDWDSVSLNEDSTPSIHPPYFELDQNSGVLYATVPYQTEYDETYTFTVRLKKFISETESVYKDRTFYLTLRGEVGNNIVFVSESNLGTLEVGVDSELYIRAKTDRENIKIEYDLVSGSLPLGLSLAIDGSIVGKILYNSQTYFDFDQYVLNNFLIDQNQTTFDRNFNFKVRARDIYNQSFIEKEFSITVLEETFTKYTKIYAAPLLPKDQRQIYKDLIEDQSIFDPSLIYRRLDPSFGVQKEIKLIIEHGLEQIHLNDFYDAFRDYFYNKKFYFGDVKVARANDENKNYVYDLVYVDIIDVYKKNQKEGLSGPVISGDYTVYPNSTISWRNSLEEISLEGTQIKVDTHLTPRFMRTSQDETGALLGFILALPICYTVPEKGQIVADRIARSNFDFKNINFEINRLIVDNNRTYDGAKYLIFPRIGMMGQNLGESQSYIWTQPNSEELVDENNIPLWTEL